MGLDGRRTGWAVGVLVVAGCQATEDLHMPVPGRLRQALTQVNELSADAQLVALGGTPEAGVPLTRGDDGVSFSGFVPALAGDYTLEVVFRGAPVSETEAIFLGRWRSDAFTVVRGEVANPVFSTPLDTIGRPEDNGDLDQDGLGNLDELIWGTSRQMMDTDGDGLSDSTDCDPTRPDRAFMVSPSGSLFDCDGDGVRRVDVPQGTAGMDCDDRNDAIFPGAEDSCADAIDSDCNPATCPIDDRQPPDISEVSPEAGSALGCHRPISARIEDDNRVVSARVVWPQLQAGNDVTLPMSDMGQDRYESLALNFGAGSALNPGLQTVNIFAVDAEGNESMTTRQYELRFSLPQVTAMTPTEVGARSSPFDIEVLAEAAEGLAAIELYRITRNSEGGFLMATAERVAETNQSPARFRVNPGTLDDGTYLFFPVVRDMVGNEARPSATVLIPTPDGLGVDVSFHCADIPGRPLVPVRVLTVGASPYQPARMQQLLSEAQSRANGVDPEAQLVSIIGFGLNSDGTVGLDDAVSFMKRWQFAFYNFATRNAVTVTWLTLAFGDMSPLVDPAAGNVGEQPAIVSPGTLVGSDAVTAQYAQDSRCPPLMGRDLDQVIYQNINGEDVVMVAAEGGSFWQARADDVQDVLFGCP